MNLLKVLAAGAAAGVILIAFRDQENGAWLLPQPTTRGDADGEREPILGYDGMDAETLREWLDDADVERDTLLRMLRYEASHRARQSVLSAIVDQL